MSIQTQDLMQSLLNKLYTVVTGGLEGMPVDTDNYVTWFAPGIAFKDDFFNYASLPPTMALASAPPPAGGTTAEQQKAALLWRYTACANAWANLANFVPSGAPLLMSSNFRQAIYHSSEELLWKVFDETLRLSQVAVSELTDKEKAKVEKFRKLLSVKKQKEDLITGEIREITEDGPILVAYKLKQQAYLAASATYKHAQISFFNAESADAVNTWRFMADDLRQAVRTANDDWVTNGYKNEVEAMAAYINQVSERDMATVKANIEDNFRQGRQTGPDGAFYYTSVIPGDFMTAGGWTNFEFNESSYSQYASQESSSWGGRAGFGFGLWSVGAGASGSSAQTQESLDTSNFKMSFEVTQVPIARGWFDPGFLTGKAWKWSKDYFGDDLSDGQMAPSGRLVAYPTTALFIRNVVIHSDTFHSNRSTYESHLKAGGRVGWGPFSIGGRYSHDGGTQNSGWSFDGKDLRVNGLQLIGFMCRFLGKAPNPSDRAQFDT
jgi:hypothetical protein